MDVQRSDASAPTSVPPRHNSGVTGLTGHPTTRTVWPALRYRHEIPWAPAGPLKSEEVLETSAGRRKACISSRSYAKIVGQNRCFVASGSVPAGSPQLFRSTGISLPIYTHTHTMSRLFSYVAENSRAGTLPPRRSQRQSRAPKDACQQPRARTVPFYGSRMTSGPGETLKTAAAQGTQRLSQGSCKGPPGPATSEGDRARVSVARFHGHPVATRAKQTAAVESGRLIIRTRRSVKTLHN